MANASADKFKNLGLRHGEKVVVGLTTGLCFLFLFSAATRPTIETTPEQVKKAADQAESNLRNRQNPEEIVKRLEEGGIKNPDFEKVVDEKTKNKIDPVAYKVASSWVTTEPGAGLIRDMPELIAPTDLIAYPGRGSALVFELDANGDRIADDTKDKADVPKNTRRKRKKNRAVGGMAMAGAGAPKKKKGNAARDEEIAKKKEAMEIAKKRGALAGTDKDAVKEAPAEPEEAQGPYKEIAKGYRWVSITGVLDYKKLRDNYLKALKSPSVAYPHFKQLEAERQVRGSDGGWSDWEPLDMERNWAVVNNLPEEEEELTPENVRLEALVDPLPFLKAGYWEKVHVASLVPKEKKDFKPAPRPQAGSEGSMGMMPGAMATPPPVLSSSSSPMMMPMMPMDGGMSGGGSENADIPKSDADTLMIRSLDFTVEPDQSYRFRLRIVVFNPNRDREDVTPGVDTKSPELFGPWSEPTEEVTMPADVATYALKKGMDARKKELVTFQVTKWNPDDGVTVIKTFDVGPGEIIGDFASAYVPTPDGEKKSRRLDFNSHQLVLDTSGGPQRVPAGLGVGGNLDTPVFSLVVRPDGSVMLRDQAADEHDEIRKNMEDNYKLELEESGKKRESSTAPGRGAR